MNWQDERYVRLYTRRTADLVAIGWEGRLCWYELLRHADRAGVIDTGGDLDLVADLIDVPLEVWKTGCARLKSRGCIHVSEAAVVIPNFLDAQQSRASDRQRQSQSRRRRRESAGLPERDVTNGHTLSHAVTNGHTSSQNVTPSRAVPCLAVPSLAVPCEGDAAHAEFQLEAEAVMSSKLGKHEATARRLWDHQNELRSRVMPRARGLQATDTAIKAVVARLEDGYSEDDCRHVLGVYAGEVAKDASKGAFFNGVTNWRPNNFQHALGQSSPDDSQEADREMARIAKEAGF